MHGVVQLTALSFERLVAFGDRAQFLEELSALRRVRRQGRLARDEQGFSIGLDLTQFCGNSREFFLLSVVYSEDMIFTLI